MARIKLAYIGGGSTRAPGTMASLIAQGVEFAGSEVVLIDLDAARLSVVQTIARKLARAAGLDLQVTATTDRRAGLQDCDAVLTSFRPGGFEARYLDESIPLKHNLIGQETQGPGGFFMALRSIAVTRAIVEEMEQVCPRARLFNYTNPVNIVAQAVSSFSSIPVVSLCEGPIYTERDLAKLADLDPALMDTAFIGLNHGSWSARHLYDGADVMPLVEEAYERKRHDPVASMHDLRFLQLTATMGSIPSSYMLYYYFHDEMLAELQAKPTTRSQDIMANVPDYWRHYREQATLDVPVLDPKRSRGGINELELALDVMAAIFNDRGEVWPVNVPNRGAIGDFPADLVVEVPGYVDRSGVTPLLQGALPRPVAGLLKLLGEYQALTAEAAWKADRRLAIQALASNPLVLSLSTAEMLYAEMAEAHREYLPSGLLR